DAGVGIELRTSLVLDQPSLNDSIAGKRDAVIADAAWGDLPPLDGTMVGGTAGGEENGVREPQGAVSVDAILNAGVAHVDRVGGAGLAGEVVVIRREAVPRRAAAEWEFE